MDPSKPTDPQVDPNASIPRSRSSEDSSEALVGEVIPKGVPIGRRPTQTDQRGPAPAPGLYETPWSPGRQAREAGKPRRKGRLRRAFVVVAALAVGFCLAGVTVGYILYDKATTPDRSSPTVTLVQYLNARFGNHDDAKARSFTCDSPQLAELDQLSDDLQSREQKFGVATEVASADPQETTNGDSATVAAYLKVTVRETTGQASRSVQRWQFSFLHQGGWRLCGAHRLDKVTQ